MVTICTGFMYLNIKTPSLKSVRSMHARVVRYLILWCNNFYLIDVLLKLVIRI